MIVTDTMIIIIIIMINSQLLICTGSSVDMVIAFIPTAYSITEIVNINLVFQILYHCFQCVSSNLSQRYADPDCAQAVKTQRLAQNVS